MEEKAEVWIPPPLRMFCISMPGSDGTCAIILARQFKTLRSTHRFGSGGKSNDGMTSNCEIGILVELTNSTSNRYNCPIRNLKYVEGLAPTGLSVNPNTRGSVYNGIL